MGIAWRSGQAAIDAAHRTGHERARLERPTFFSDAVFAAGMATWIAALVVLSIGGPLISLLVPRLASRSGGKPA